MARQETDDAVWRTALRRHAALFDVIEKTPLTEEQRFAAVVAVQRQLLVAAAGSGKTSTIVGKVGYVLASGQCKPAEILVLAFNTRAALELEQRLNERLRMVLPDDVRVTVRTLHALGLEVVTHSQQRRPKVLEESGIDLLQSVLAWALEHDAEFAEQWLLFRIFYHATVRHPDDFHGLRAWKSFVRQHGDRCGRRWGFMTLLGECVSTQFEQAIANWLYLYDIAYEYRPVSNRRRWGGWLPERWRLPLSGVAAFYIPKHDLLVCCVFKNAKVGHRRPKGRKQVLYVGLDEFRAGSVFQRLKARLGMGSVSLPPGRMRVVASRLGYYTTPGQWEFLQRFVRHARLNRANKGQSDSRVQQGSDNARVQLLAPALGRLLQAYEQFLMRAGGIDFEGMLRDAATGLEQGAYRHPYRLILVDEFQDMSQAGIRLLQSLLKQDKACRLFAVGDDWQSIYHFAGAAPDALRNFDEYFGKAVVTYLTATFRFNQRIADIATYFIQKNPAQLRKQVRAQVGNDEDAIVIGAYLSLPHMMELCLACLSEIAINCSEHHAGRRSTVYILGRYQHQRPRSLSAWQKRFPSLQIEFQTVHAVKGLEADAVIVLGLQAGRYGFPGEVRDDPLLKRVMPPSDNFPHAEERRLFYVAMTRTRGSVYLLADVSQPSQFVLEIMTLSSIRKVVLASDGCLQTGDLFDASW